MTHWKWQVEVADVFGVITSSHIDLKRLKLFLESIAEDFLFIFFRLLRSEREARSSTSSTRRVVWSRLIVFCTHRLCTPTTTVSFLARFVKMRIPSMFSSSCRQVVSPTDTYRVLGWGLVLDVGILMFNTTWPSILGCAAMLVLIGDNF